MGFTPLFAKNPSLIVTMGKCIHEDLRSHLVISAALAKLSHADNPTLKSAKETGSNFISLSCHLGRYLPPRRSSSDMKFVPKNTLLKSILLINLGAKDI